jgi:hypothetical protein
VEITVRNFQAIGHASLRAEGLTVIVGPSDRGKSALLRAIEAGLFNRVGDGFVRVGQASAEVQLVLDGHEVRWEKGSGKNRFMVDGTEYGRVGREAPPVLKTLGFRDELIGARVTEEGTRLGGEVMRPQVARQFDSIFLLDKPGGFVNETMVRLSRLGVLQRANRLCSADLRATKQTLGAQTEIAQQARAAADRLQPVVALRARVEALVARVIAMEAARQQLDALRALVAVRQTVVKMAQVQLPETSRAAMGRVVQRGLVTATLRSQLVQRALYQPRVGVLPAAARPDKRWWKRGELCQSVTPLLGDRRRTLARIGTLPPPRQLDQHILARVWLYQSLRPVAHTRQATVATLAALAEWGTRWEDTYQYALDQLAAFKRKIKVCPVCEQPFNAS